METTDIELQLSRLKKIPEPDPSREQYQTPSFLASKIIETAEINNDLESPVVDLGCGSGILAIAASLIGYDSIGIDVDKSALKTAIENTNILDPEGSTDWIQADITETPIQTRGSTVLMNPPFGAQRKGADRAFLDTASDISSTTYSIHNSGSRDFVERYIDGEITQAYSSVIPIEHQFDFHNEAKKEIEVEIYRIEF